jgi:hypothetical protein
MWTASAVARHVNKLTHGQLLTTRDLLSYGTRSAVDQAVAKLVRLGYIKRLARGVFVRLTEFRVPDVSAAEVAETKAAAFGKQILPWGADGCKNSVNDGSGQPQVMFASSGCTSQFRFGDMIVCYRAVSARKFNLGVSKVGRSLRTLWQLGRRLCDAHSVMDAVRGFYRSDFDEIRRPVAASLLPAWLTKLFYVQWKIEKRKNKIEREYERKEAEHRQMLSNRTSETTILLQSGMFELTNHGLLAFVADQEAMLD